MDNGTIWLIGGNSMAYPMAQEIKRRGYSLLLTDLDPACVCRPLADRFAPVSVYSETDNLNFARWGMHVRPKAIVTAGTDAGVEVSAVAEYFGLPAAPVEVSRRIRNKVQLRKCLQLEHPHFATGTPEELAGWEIYPCVVKPADASGSKGFSRVNEPEALPAAFCKATEANRDGSRLVLIEELLIPKDVMPEFSDYHTAEIALDFLVQDGVAVWANGALRLFDKSRPGIEAGHFNPWWPGDSIIQQVQEIAEKLGVTSGPLKVDYMQDERYGWVLQEMATRLSGGYDSSYTAPLATGRDIVSAYLDLALGQDLDLKKLENKKGCVACCLAPVHKPGRISGWVEHGSIAGQVFYQTQTEIKPLESNADRPVFILADGLCHQEAYEAAREVSKRVIPIYS